LDFSNYPKYCGSARSEDVKPVARGDIEMGLKYLKDKFAKKPKPIVNKSYKELNPDLFTPIEKIRDWKEKNMASKSRDRFYKAPFPPENF
jgi:hypothetical protein